MHSLRELSRAWFRGRLELMVEGHDAFRRHAIGWDDMERNRAVGAGSPFDFDRRSGRVWTRYLIGGDNGFIVAQGDDVSVGDRSGRFAVGFLRDHGQRDYGPLDAFGFHDGAIETKHQEQQYADTAGQQGGADGPFPGVRAQKRNSKMKAISQTSHHDLPVGTRW